MLSKEQIEIRKPFWEAFSDLWLDNEIQDFEIEYTADLMKSNDLGLSEFENILYLEVAPVVYKNLHSVAGEWTGFDPKWLFDSIIENIKKQESNPIYRTWVNSSPGRYLMTSMVMEDWNKVIELYQLTSFEE